MNNDILTFVGGKFFKDFPQTEGITKRIKQEVPNNTYVYHPGGGTWEASWYLYEWNNFTPINLSDVPKELKAALLILI